MIHSRLLASSAFALALSSCASNKADTYDTANPYGAAMEPAGVNASPAEPSNPIYDTPAAYEESGAPAPIAGDPPVSPAFTTPSAPGPAPARAPSNGAAIIHTVVAGDTLSGISAKYRVPSAAIRQANNMTNDIVVLGRKMVIPPVQ